MKTLLKVLLVGILVWSPLAAVTGGAQQVEAAGIPDHIVRVHLSSYGAPSTFKMNATGTHKIQDNGKSISGNFTVAASGGRIRLTDGDAVYNLDGDITISAASTSVDHRIQINGNYRYPGDFRIISRGGGLKLINTLDVETYLTGVLPYEVNDSWPLESLKAQAVAARTYTWFTMYSRNRTAAEQDLVNTTASQVYNGVNAANPNCVRAINETAKKILKTKGGENVYACFSASNGGYTEYPKASGASSVNFSYLPFKADPWDLKYALNSSSYSAKVTIPKTISPSKIKSSTSQPYPMLRNKLNAAGVKVSQISENITIRSISLHSPRYTNPSRVYTGANIVVGLPGGKQVTLNFAPYINAKGTKKPFLNRDLNLSDRNKFSRLYVRNDEDSYLVAALRYGHAAGMSQVGALQMAREGMTYEDILTFYYLMGDKTKLTTMDWDIDQPDLPPGAGAGKDVYMNARGTVNVSSTLNVRSGPGTSYSVIGVLKDKTAVNILASNGSWYKIAFAQGSGYISGAYVKLSGTGTAPKTTKKATVKVASGSYLNVRSGPGTDRKILGTLKKGTSITITGSSGSWYQIKYKGKTGYVKNTFVKITTSTASKPAAKPAATKTGTVKLSSGTLNVRSGPGTSYKILGSLKKGAKVTITGSSGDWYKIKYKNKTCYVKKSFIRLS